MPLFTGGCLQEFRGPELVGRPAGAVEPDIQMALW